MMEKLFNGNIHICKDKWVFIRDDGTLTKVNTSEIEALWIEVNKFLHEICGFHYCESKKYFCQNSDLKCKREFEYSVYCDIQKLANHFPNSDYTSLLKMWLQKMYNHFGMEEDNQLEELDIFTQQAINDLIEEDEEEVKFDYREWINKMLQITDGEALFEHLFSLPPSRSTYGRIQVINGVSRILKNYKLRAGYDNHIQVMNSKLDKRGKFSISSLTKKNLAKFIDGMASRIDAIEFVDLWRLLLQTIQTVLRDAIMQDKPLDKKVPIETQRWAFVAHLMADTSLHGLFSEIQRGPDRVEQHNEGGYQEWYLQKYNDVLKLGNVDSYTNEWEDKNFKYTHPKTEETRTRTTPLKGIDPKDGVITDPKQLQQIRTQMMGEYDKLTTMMCASGSNEMSMDRIMFYCTKGSCFQTKLFYIASVLMDVDTQFKSKRAYGTSIGITLGDAEKEGEESDPHLMRITTDSSGKKKKRRSDSSTLAPSSSNTTLEDGYDAHFLRLQCEKNQMEKEKNVFESRFKKSTFILQNKELFSTEEYEQAKLFIVEN